MRPGAYLTILRTPQALRLLASSVVVGVAGTMTPVALVLFARHAAGSYAAASAVLAAETLGGIVSSPYRGRLVDRHGAATALPALAVVTAAADGVFIGLGAIHAPTAALAAVSLLGGATGPPIGASLRNAWRDILGSGSDLRAAYALLTIRQEIAFVLGPLIAGAVLAAASSTWAVAVAAAAALAGSLAFATAPAIRNQRGLPTRRSRLGALASPGLRTVVATAALFGATFGILDVAMPAFAQGRHAAAAAGLLLAAFAVGLGIGGFLYGLTRSRSTTASQYPRLCALAACGLAPLIALPGLGILGGLMVVAGLCFAPITTAQMAILDEVAVDGTRTEAMTWVGTAYGVGAAAGAALAGQLVDAAGVRLAVTASVLTTSIAFAMSWTLRRSLRQTHETAGAAARSSATGPTAPFAGS